VGDGVGNHVAGLDVEALDLRERAGRGAVGGQLRCQRQYSRHTA
jgi:hypothetical protein